MSIIRFSLPIRRSYWLWSNFEYLYARLLPIGLVLGTLLVSVGLAYMLVNFSPALAFGAVLAIPIGVLLIVRPNFGLLVVVFAIPLQDFNQFGDGLSVFKLLSLAVFGGAIGHFLIFRRRDSLVGAPQNWVIIFFVFIIFLSNFVAIDLPATLDRTFKMLRVLSLYLVAINIVQSEKDLKYLVFIFFISGMMSALYGIYTFYLAPSLLNVDGRLTGTMGDPNQFAASMIARLPLMLSLLVVEKHRQKQLFLLLGAGIMVYAVTLTGSRGGLLSMGLSFILFAFLQKNRGVWLTVLVIASIVGLVAMPLSMKQRVGLVKSDAPDRLGNSTDRRESYQIFGWQLAQQNPILGVGLRGFTEAYAHSEYRFLQGDSEGRVAHNTYLEIVTGTGFVGLTGFLLLLGTSMFMAWKFTRYRNNYPYLGNVAVGLFAGQGGFFLSILFLSEQYSKTLWLLIALVVMVQNIINTAEHQRLLLALSAKDYLKPGTY